METKEYKWRIESFAKKVDVNDVIIEFEQIKQKSGKLTPETVVQNAKNKKSILHELFEWDNTIAGEKYRLQQARTIINNVEVVTVSNGEQIEIPNYEIVTTDEGREYKSIDTLTYNEVEQIRETCKLSLIHWGQKLKRYKEFEKAYDFIDKAVQAI